MQTLKRYAFSLLGLPYRWGGDDPILGFDCSGLVIEILQSAGELPHGFDTTAQGLYNRYASKDSRPALGTLVFFGRGEDRITHVGFMIDNFRMIEAGGGNSLTDNSKTAAEQNACVRIRPLSLRRDLIGFGRPEYAFLNATDKPEQCLQRLIEAL